MNLAVALQNNEVKWTKADGAIRAYPATIEATSQALDRAELLWGVTDLSTKFRRLLKTRGLTMYDRTIANHFTGSAIVLDPVGERILLTYHPTYNIWQQLGGHDEGEHNPVAVSTREAYEESGIDDLWVCDWPVRIDPHPAVKCKYVTVGENNQHYDICYVSLAYNTVFQKSDESVDMKWVTLSELNELVKRGEAQQRAFEMAANSIALFENLRALGKLPKPLR